MSRRDDPKDRSSPPEDEVDAVLRESAALSREEAESAPSADWDGLAAGKLDEARLEGLRLGDDAERLEAAFAPLPDDLYDRIGGEIEASWDNSIGPKEEREQEEAEASHLTLVASTSEGEGAIAARSSGTPRRAWLGGALATFAVAAAATLVVVSHEQPAATLHPYALEMSAGIQQSRGADPTDEAPRYAPETALRAVLRPESPLSERPWLILVTRSPDGLVQRHRPPVERTADGVFRVVGTAGEIFAERLDIGAETQPLEAFSIISGVEPPAQEGRALLQWAESHEDVQVLGASIVLERASGVEP